MGSHLKPSMDDRGGGPAVWVPVAGLVAVYVLCFLWSPIAAGDTDLWYHLNGARYLVQTGRIPDHSFFSFVDPPRPWTDYYWLFQALAYGIYEAAGYPGLVVYRAVAYGAICTLVVLFFARGGGRRAALCAFIGVTLYAVFLYPRYTLVRPHTLSYLLLVLCLWILESRSRLVYALPLLSVLWVNLHGITYPVLFVVLGAYLLDWAWDLLRGSGGPAGRRLAPGLVLALSLLAPYATPHGLKLLGVPFTPTGFASEYINELAKLRVADLAALGTQALVPTPWTVVVIVGGLALGGLLGGPFRPSRVVLLAAAVGLLVRGQRFLYEFVLLTLPLVTAPGGLPRLAEFLLRRRWVAWGVVAVFLAVNASFAWSVVRDRGRYPFSPENLPVGVVAFLKTAGPGGRLLNHPNAGGYLQWELYPRYRIYMDMEVPFFFTDEDMFRAVNAFSDPTVFGGLVEQYRPQFVTVPIGAREFKAVQERYPRYRLVFFDDAEALYADREQLPDLVEAFEIRHLDPFEIFGRKLDDLLKDVDETEVEAEVERLLRVHPGSGLGNQLMAMLLLRRHEYEAALEHARTVIEWFPSSPRGHKLAGDALKGLGRLEEALEAYRRVTRRSSGTLAEAAWRQMGLVYTELGSRGDAYRALKRGVRPFRPTTGYKDLYFLGSAAFLTGRVDEARTLLGFARLKVPASDAEWAERLERQAALVEAAAGPGPEAAGR